MKLFPVILLDVSVIILACISIPIVFGVPIPVKIMFFPAAGILISVVWMIVGIFKIAITRRPRARTVGAVGPLARGDGMMMEDKDMCTNMWDHEWEEDYYGYQCTICGLWVPADYFDFNEEDSNERAPEY